MLILRAALRALAAHTGPGRAGDGVAPEVMTAAAAKEERAASAELAAALGLTLGAIEVRDELAHVQVTCPGVQVAEALALALGRASASQQLPLARLELGRRPDL